MLELNVDVWELVVRSIAVYGVLLIAMRLSGRRTVGQFTPFDLLVVLLLSEAAGASLTGEDQSLPGGLIVCLVLLALNAAVGILTSRVRGAEHLLEGEVVILGRAGQVLEAVRKKHRVSKNDIDKALRQAGCQLEDMEAMLLEVDGSLCVIKKR